MDLFTVSDKLIMKKNVQKKDHQSLITVPDVLGEKTDGYEVIATGPGFLSQEGIRLPMSIMVGDTVYLPKGLVRETTIAGEVYFTTSEREVEIFVKK